MEKLLVVLTDDTKTRDNKGLFGLDKQILSNSVLIPGLKVKVDATSDDQGRVVAKIITVDEDDPETAEMTEAGMHPTAEQVEANVQAIASKREGVVPNQEQLAKHLERIAANEQDIAANKQQIEQNINIKDTEENRQRFMALADHKASGTAS